MDSHENNRAVTTCDAVCWAAQNGLNVRTFVSVYEILKRDQVHGHFLKRF